MIRIKPEFGDPRRVGERYLDEIPGPIEFGEYTHSDELWAYFSGTVQGRPCEIRIAAIRDDFLSGIGGRSGCTCVALIREAASIRGGLGVGGVPEQSMAHACRDRSAAPTLHRRWLAICETTHPGFRKQRLARQRLGA